MAWTSTRATTPGPSRLPPRYYASSPAPVSLAFSTKRKSRKRPRARQGMLRITSQSKRWQSLRRCQQYPKYLSFPNMPTLICDCNKTMPLQEKTLGAALGEQLPLHSSLCRREAGAFQQAVQGGAQVVVACTQEQRLFGEIGQQTAGAVSPVKFVNIRETGGWSRDASRAMPKIAALLAAAHLPDPEPVPTVAYKSAGRLLVIGPMEQAERIAGFVGDVLDVTLFTQ